MEKSNHDDERLLTNTAHTASVAISTCSTDNSADFVFNAN